MTDFAYYRLPYSDKYTKIESEGNFKILGSVEEIGNDSGFVISPFHNGDTVLIPADMITRGILPVNRQIVWNSQINYCVDDNYRTVFTKFHNAVIEGSFDKLVLARTKDMRLMDDVDLYKLFIDCCSLFPRLMIMLFHTQRIGTWLIASPEILLESHLGSHHTVAMAGTMPFCEGYSVWSEKNKEEQKIVEKYIFDTLAEQCSDILVDGPVSMRAGHLQHLRTDFRFKGSKIGNIVSALHPTPAVSGFPVNKAIDFILKQESIERKYYSGFCGPVNIEGDTHLYVSLRCAEIDQDNGKAVLYGGGGIMPDSDCNSEWIETEQKISTLSCILTKRI